MKTFNRQLKCHMRDRKLRRWWDKNGHIILRILLFPLWIGILVNEKIKAYQYENMVYSDKRSKQILDRYLPRLFSIIIRDGDPDQPIRVLVSNSHDPYGIDISWDRGLGIPKRRRRDYTYYQKFYTQVQEYLWTRYEIDGWKAIRLNDWTSWDRVEQEYDWAWKCWSKDYSKGVYFIKEAV